MELEEKYRRAIEVLLRYEAWEANSLNADTPSIFDEMNEAEYSDWMEVQSLRNEVLTRARLENYLPIVTQEMVDDTKFMYLSSLVEMQKSIKKDLGV